MQAAIDEARLGRSQGGIPIGSVLVRDGKIIEFWRKDDDAGMLMQLGALPQQA